MYSVVSDTCTAVWVVCDDYKILKQQTECLWLCLALSQSRGSIGLSSAAKLDLGVVCTGGVCRATQATHKQAT